MPGGETEMSAGMRVAVVDVGTNSTRLLIGDVADGRVYEIDRRSQVTRLGRGVDLSGNLATEAIDATCAVIGEYVAAYRELGVTAVVALATSAVRDAVNGDAFIAELRERFALDARILDGEEEAQLTFRGATAGQLPAQPVVVIDIGGGSTELIVGDFAGIDFDSSIQAGVVRHSERHLASDPPTPGELERLAGDVRGLISTALSSQAGVYAESGIAVAGTPTSLASIDQRLDPYDPRRVQGYRLSLDAIQHMLSKLAAMPLAERREVIGLDPDRAPTIVAGVVILIEAMRAFGIGEIEVSERDILHGAALEAAQARNPQ